MPGKAASRPATTRRSVGTPVIRRSTRKTRSERSTLKVSVAGTSAIPMTTKSNTLQGSRKNARRWTITRAAISTTNTARMMWSRISSSLPIRCHHRLAGLQTKDDGVDDDERHDHALGARIVDDGTEPGEHGSPLRRSSDARLNPRQYCSF